MEMTKWRGKCKWPKKKKIWISDWMVGSFSWKKEAGFQGDKPASG